jgi:hypothetical protein
VPPAARPSHGKGGNLITLVWLKQFIKTHNSVTPATKKSEKSRQMHDLQETGIQALIAYDVIPHILV